MQIIRPPCASPRCHLLALFKILFSSARERGSISCIQKYFLLDHKYEVLTDSTPVLSAKLFLIVDFFLPYLPCLSNVACKNVHQFHGMRPHLFNSSNYLFYASHKTPRSVGIPLPHYGKLWCRSGNGLDSADVRASSGTFSQDEKALHLIY